MVQEKKLMAKERHRDIAAVTSSNSRGNLWKNGPSNQRGAVSTGTDTGSWVSVVVGLREHSLLTVEVPMPPPPCS